MPAKRRPTDLSSLPADFGRIARRAVETCLWCHGTGFVRLTGVVPVFYLLPDGGKGSMPAHVHVVVCSCKLANRSN